VNVLKLGLVMAAGLGSTWAARTATQAWLDVQPPARLAQAAGDEASAPAPAAAGTPPVVPEMSREEMEAELKRAQAELGGRKDESELREFRPSRPLPADLPISLPSDI